jgi:hypothetical protein
MRFSEFHPVDEAAMNPCEFAQAIEQGQARGVLVGFEFEVCIPQATFAQSKNTARTTDQVAEMLRSYNVLSDIYFRQVTPEAWDQVFRLRQPVGNFASMAEAYSSYQDKFVNQLQQLYNQIPEKQRAKYRDRAMQDAKNLAKAQGLKKTDPGYDRVMQRNFAERMGRIVYSNNNGNAAERAGRALMDASRQDWPGLLEYALGQPLKSIEQNFNQLFDYDANQAYDLLDLSVYEDDEYGQDPEYQRAAEFLKPMIEQTMGAPVHIFQRYHQRGKNLTDWYIEPDSSLDANNDEDATAEIVSPPLPAAQAVDALKRFYAMAGQLNLYTNNSTGLHINVSIPDKLDVLKLAVFTGDQHVLQQFGRQNNDYAVSSQQSIAGRVASGSPVLKTKTAKKPGVVGQPKTQTTLDVKSLQRIAQDATGAHTASISDNGKYISFRHAGGDYLQNYTSVFNVVGRFIRAMIIASDPTLYAQEYQTKLAKLAGAGLATSQSTVPTMLQSIRTQGMPVIQLDVMRFGKKRTPLNLALDAMDGHTAIANNNVTVTGGGNATRSVLNAKAFEASDYQRKLIAKAPADSFFSMLVVPQNLRQVEIFSKMQVHRNTMTIEKHGGWEDSGLALYTKSTLPPTDPRTIALMKRIWTEYQRSKPRTQ